MAKLGYTEADAERAHHKAAVGIEVAVLNEGLPGIVHTLGLVAHLLNEILYELREAKYDG